MAQRHIERNRQRASILAECDGAERRIPRTTRWMPPVARALALALGLALVAAVPGTSAGQAGPPARLPGLKAGPARPGAAPAKDDVARPRRDPRAVRALGGEPPKPGEGLSRGGAAGVIKRDAGALPAGFDPAKLGKEDEPVGGAAKGDGEKGIEDMIEFKSNFERGIKCRKLPLKTKISLDFEDAPLDDVVKFIGCITATNFIMAKALGKGQTITIMSPEPVSAYEAFKVFLVALEMNGMTVVPTGKFLKIVPMAEARQDTIPIIGAGRSVPDDERLVTRVIELEHVDANEIQAVLQKFKTKHGDITVYAPTNTIFVTDLSTNIRRLLRLVKELDQPIGKDRVWVRQIEYADATQLVDKLMGVFGPQGTAGRRVATPGRPAPRPAVKGGRPVPAQATTTTVGEPSQVEVSKIMADDRTNQLIIVANATAYFKLDKLIRKLDVPIPGEGAIHIHYLENADAEEIAQTLSGLVQGGGGAAAARGRAARRPAAAKPGAAPGAAGGTTAALFGDDVRITAYKPTNSLIIQSTLKDYMSLKTVIEKLDTRRKQVYVEAIIMEVTSTKDRKFGIGGSGGTSFDIDGETIPLLLAMGGLGVSGLDAQQLTKGGLAVGLQGPLLDVDTGTGTGQGSLSGTFSLPSFGFLIQAIQTNSDVNILSTPHILTTDNEEAEIQVGKQIPYQAQSLGGLGGLAGGLGALGGLGGTSRLGGSSGLDSLGGLGSSLGLLGGLGGLGGSVQRIDVDLTLKITPHINESNYVKLETELQIDDVESFDRTLGPTTSKRRVTNVVVVRDQQPVVIGGLIRDTESQAVDKVPVLGDIPLIGVMFRKTSTQVEKKNLLMIIIPHIIEDPAVDLKRIHEQKMEEMRRYSEYMATRKKEYLGEIDYSKKHGALEEMHKTIARARQDRELLERSVFEATELDTVGPPETHDIEYDPYEGAKPAGPLRMPDLPDDEMPVLPGGEAVLPPEDPPERADPVL